MTRRIPTLAIIFIVGVGGIIIAWLLNPYSAEKINGEGEFNLEGDKKEVKKNSMVIDSLELTSLGRSGFKLKSGETVLYIDPYKIDHEERGNLALVTNEEFDNLDLTSILALSDGNTTILTTSEGLQRFPAGVREIKPLEAGQTYVHLGIEVRAVPAYGSGLGFVIKWNGRTFYHAGKTKETPPLENLGPFDVAMIPIGGGLTFDEKEAAEAVRIIKPNVVIPMYYGLTTETSFNPLKFKELVGDSAEVRILE